MAYQSFPWLEGDSRSLLKLSSLYLPQLKGRSVLDIGCNSGYFCGWAQFQGAARVVGIDQNKGFLSQAKLLFPQCEFLCLPWDRALEKIRPGKFDIILCLSAIHYAQDQKALIDKLMDTLSPTGILVLEVGIVKGPGRKFVPVQRAIDTRLFPTLGKLEQILSPYIYKSIGEGARQYGDPVPRFVYHIQKRKPVVVLFMDDHYMGKSSSAARIMHPDLPIISGDDIYQAILNDKLQVSEEMRQSLRDSMSGGRLDSGVATEGIFTSGLAGELLALFCKQADNRDFVLDAFIPAKFRSHVVESFGRHGFYPIQASLHPDKSADWIRQHTRASDFIDYHNHLKTLADIDEEAYLREYPEVEEAIRNGVIDSAKTHYLYFGRHEGRTAKPKKQD